MTDKEMESAITWLGQTLLKGTGTPHIDTINWARNWLDKIAQALEAQERAHQGSDQDSASSGRR